MTDFRILRAFLNRFLLTGLGITILFVSCLSTSAYAFESRLNQLKAQYPTWPNTTNNGTHGCLTCHTSNAGGGTNSYRSDFSANSSSFTAIESLDSDGDGVSNINEILVGFHPGWKAGDSGVNSLGVNISAFLTPQNDLSLNMMAPSSVTVGQNITYQLTVANAGPQDATNVQLTNTLPANVTFVSSNPSQGNCSINSAVITCALGRVNNGSSATVSIVATASTVGQQMNTGTVTAGQLEISANNNAASVTTNVSQVVMPPPGGGPNSATGYLPAVISLLLSEAPTELISGVPVMDSVELSLFKLYKIAATRTVNNILVEITNLSADVDLYVRLGDAPTLSVYACRPFFASTLAETCSVPIPATPVPVYIGVYGYRAGSYTIEATLRTLK